MKSITFHNEGGDFSGGGASPTDAPSRLDIVVRDARKSKGADIKFCWYVHALDGSREGPVLDRIEGIEWDEWEHTQKLRPGKHRRKLRILSPSLPLNYAENFDVPERGNAQTAAAAAPEDRMTRIEKTLEAITLKLGTPTAAAPPAPSPAGGGGLDLGGLLVQQMAAAQATTNTLITTIIPLLVKGSGGEKSDISEIIAGVKTIHNMTGGGGGGGGRGDDDGGGGGGDSVQRVISGAAAGIVRAITDRQQQPQHQRPQQQPPRPALPHPGHRPNPQAVQTHPVIQAPQPAPAPAPTPAPVQAETPAAVGGADFDPAARAQFALVLGDDGVEVLELIARGMLDSAHKAAARPSIRDTLTNVNAGALLAALDTEAAASIVGSLAPGELAGKLIDFLPALAPHAEYVGLVEAEFTAMVNDQDDPPDDDQDGTTPGRDAGAEGGTPNG